MYLTHMHISVMEIYSIKLCDRRIKIQFQGKKEGQGWVEVGKGRWNGDIYNSINNKNKEIFLKEKQKRKQ